MNCSILLFYINSLYLHNVAISQLKISFYGVKLITKECILVYFAIECKISKREEPLLGTISPCFQTGERRIISRNAHFNLVTSIERRREV
jgi:hypothetical protein